MLHIYKQTTVDAMSGRFLSRSTVLLQIMLATMTSLALAISLQPSGSLFGNVYKIDKFPRHESEAYYICARNIYNRQT